LFISISFIGNTTAGMNGQRRILTCSYNCHELLNYKAFFNSLARG
jgi:hypothetical protein